VIKQITSEIENLEGVICAILFGSLAEDRYTGSSDADVLIVIDKKLPQDERYRRYNRISANIDVQTFILTLDEATSRINNGDTFVINIVTTGIPLFGEKIFKHLKKLCEKAINQYGLEKTTIGWIRKKTI